MSSGDFLVKESGDL